MILLLIPFFIYVIYQLVTIKREIFESRKHCKADVHYITVKVLEVISLLEKMPQEFEVREIVEEQVEALDKKLSRELQYLHDQITGVIQKESSELAKIHKEKKVDTFKSLRVALGGGKAEEVES